MQGRVVPAYVFGGGGGPNSMSDSGLMALPAVPSLPRPSQDVPEATPSCVTSVATLTDAALLPQPPSRRLCQPPSQQAPLPDGSFAAAAEALPGSPFRSGAFAGVASCAYSSGAFNSSALNSSAFNSSVLYSGGVFNSGPFGSHQARASTGELYNSVALKKGVLVEFRGSSMETSEPSTRIGALTATFPRGPGGGSSVYSSDRDMCRPPRRSRCLRRGGVVSTVRPTPCSVWLSGSVSNITSCCI